MRAGTRTIAGALALLVTLAGGVRAGDTVVPWWAVSKENSAKTNRPWGIHQLRFQQVFEAGSIPLTASVALKELAFRAEGATANLGYSITADMEVGLCTTKRHTENLSTVFADNLGIDLVVVLPRKKYIFNGFQQPASAPAPFDIRLILDRPFTLDPGKNLLLEVRIWGNEGGGLKNWDYPCWMDAMDQRNGPMVYFGPSCLGSAGWPAVTGRGGQIAHLTGVELWTAPARAAAIGILGLSRTQLGPLNLPLDLTPFGAPGCALHISPELLVAVVADASGFAAFDVRLPLDRHLVGRSLFGQYLVLDPPANPAGLTASGAVEIEIIQKAYTGSVWANHDPAASSGVAAPYQGPVTKLVW